MNEVKLSTTDERTNAIQSILLITKSSVKNFDTSGILMFAVAAKATGGVPASVKCFRQCVPDCRRGKALIWRKKVCRHPSSVSVASSVTRGKCGPVKMQTSSLPSLLFSLISFPCSAYSFTELQEAASSPPGFPCECRAFHVLTQAEKMFSWKTRS